MYIVREYPRVIVYEPETPVKIIYYYNKIRMTEFKLLIK